MAAAVAVLGGLLLLLIYAVLGAYTYLAPTLPTADDLRGRDRQIPLRVYTRSGALIAQIGEQLRVPVRYDEIPQLVREAFLAAEDDNFFSHSGIDFRGVLRAMYVNISTGDFSQGGSTITMQVARNVFLSSDKTIKRKLQEVFLTFRMEHDFSKEQILNTYLNVIFFGQRAYGVAAAAEVYFGRNLSELSVAEAATLAGLPKAPSRYNPVTNPGKAIERRHYVLQRMLALRYIDPQSAERAQREPMRAREFAPLFEVEAPYVAEMVRQEVIARFGEAAINAGYRVTTTIDGRLQTAANRAVRLGLLEYDRRHGYRGALRRAQSGPGASAEVLEKDLAGVPLIGNLRPAVVVSVAPKSARVYVGSQGFAQIDWDGLSWARKPSDAAAAAGIVTVGDVVYVVANGNAAQLVQLPQAQGALVSLDPDDGAIVALVGGYDYNTSKFNRVTQAQRQPGSGFKPFIYSAALEHGFTPASIIMDAPIMSEDRNAEQSWRPQNSSGDFSGPMRMREALVRSRNLVSIRLLRGMGPDEAINYATRFGFAARDLPRNETLALGTLSATPLQIATGYATFANGGFKVDSYFIDRIENNEGEVVWRAAPKQVCEPCDLRDQATAAISSGIAPTTSPGNALATTPVAITATAPRASRAAQCPRTDDDTEMAPELRAPRVISAANAWLMDDMLADVVRRGTGRGALVLGRKDIAGKTGTTNEERDTWFNGFNRGLIASVWVGYDQSIPLGDGEEGSRTAVPIWVNYMREALRAVPDIPRPRPATGLVTARISPSTGQLASADDPSAIDETFLAEHLPMAAAAGDQTQNVGSNTSSEPLF